MVVRSKALRFSIYLYRSHPRNDEQQQQRRGDSSDERVAEQVGAAYNRSCRNARRAHVDVAVTVAVVGRLSSAALTAPLAKLAWPEAQAAR